MKNQTRSHINWVAKQSALFKFPKGTEIMNMDQQLEAYLPCLEAMLANVEEISCT